MFVYPDSLLIQELVRPTTANHSNRIALLANQVQIWRARIFTALFTGYKFFPALFTGYKLFPLFSTVTCFPALATRYPCLAICLVTGHVFQTVQT